MKRTCHLSRCWDLDRCKQITPSTVQPRCPIADPVVWCMNAGADLDEQVAKLMIQQEVSGSNSPPPGRPRSAASDSAKPLPKLHGSRRLRFGQRATKTDGRGGNDTVQSGGPAGGAAAESQVGPRAAVAQVAPLTAYTHCMLLLSAPIGILFLLVPFCCACFQAVQLPVRHFPESLLSFWRSLLCHQVHRLQELFWMLCARP